MQTSSSSAQSATQIIKPSSKPAWPYRMWPLLYTIRTYQTRHLLIDLPTGITQAVLHIPQGMAYALLAGVDPIYGLYVSFIPPLIYSLFSSTKHVSIGTFAVVSILCHAVLNKRGLLSQDHMHQTLPDTLSLPTPPPPNDPAITIHALAHVAPLPAITPNQVLSTLALLVGVFIFAMGLLRFGSFSRLLSTPLVSAFTCAAALHVACSQLPPIFGITLNQRSGPLSLPQNLWSLAQSIPQKTSLSTLGFSTGCIVLLIAFRLALRPLCRRYPWIPSPPPIELFLIAFSAWLTHEFQLDQRWHLAVLGHIPAGLPDFQPPPVMRIVDWPLVLDALLIAFLITALMLSLVKLYAPEDESTQPNRQLASLGLANLLSCSFGCFPSAPSLSRSSVLRGSMHCTPMANVYSSAILLLVLLYLGPLFASLPKCVLSCIILVALKGLLMQFNKLIQYARDSRPEALVWLSAYVPTVLFDLYIGFLCGLCASLIHLLVQYFRSKSKLDTASTDAEIEQIP